MKFSNSRRPIQSGPANDSTRKPNTAAAGAATMARANMRAQARAPQNRLNRKALGHALRWIDMFAISIISISGTLVLSNGDIETINGGSLLPLIGFAIMAPWLLRVASVYRVEPKNSPLHRVLIAFVAVGVSGISATLIAQYTATENLAGLATHMVIAVASLTSLHLIYAGFIRHWANAGRLSRNVVLVGATPNSRKLIDANTNTGYVNVVGIFDDRKTRSPASIAGAPYLGDIDDLFNWTMLHEVDRIVLTVTPSAVGRVQILLERLRALPQPVCLVLDIDGFDPSDTSLDEIVGVPSARMSGTEERLGHLFIKRVQDIVFGTLMFVGLIPVMMLIGLLVKLSSPGPILFKQTREGFNGRPIMVMKFRSMRHDPQSDIKVVRQVEFNDPRVTSFGNFLRKSSLDELPQLWNVIMGDMSLVGPRPHAPSMKTGGTETSKLVAEYAHRHRVKPGITGWAQINGSRGPLHSPEAARDRIRWDVDYISKSNFWFDLWIMVRTLPALLGDKINIR